MSDTRLKRTPSVQDVISGIRLTRNALNEANQLIAQHQRNRGIAETYFSHFSQDKIRKILDYARGRSEEFAGRASRESQPNLMLGKGFAETHFPDLPRKVVYYALERQCAIDRHVNQSLLFPTRIWTEEKQHQHKEQEGRRIILCFDGTGNHFCDNNSNVLQFFKCLQKNDPYQVVYYQTGMGTYTHPWLTTKLAVNLSMKLDEAIAWNLENHVEDAYRFLMQTYRDGDKISLFGFSRGAYVARVLAGFLQKIGLLPQENIAQIPFAWKVFKKSDSKAGFKDCVEYKKAFCISVKIEFMGLWDTVASLGVSGRELPFAIPEVENYIRVFRQALALDERRAKFKPNFKLPLRQASNPVVEADQGAKGNADHINTQDTLEVWFAGCHCDVGGGAVEEKTRPSLALIPLRWMIRECFRAETNIIFDAEMLEAIGLSDSQIVSRTANTGVLGTVAEMADETITETVVEPVVEPRSFRDFKERYPHTIPKKRYESPSIVTTIVTTFIGFIFASIWLLVQWSWRILKFTLLIFSSPVRYIWYIVKNTILAKHIHSRIRNDLEEQPVEAESQESQEDECNEDAFSDMHDQLPRGLWCIFEGWPLVFRLQDSQIRGRGEHETHINWGRGREIYGDAWNRDSEGGRQYINVHRSVSNRMRSGNYRPRAWFFLDPNDRTNPRIWNRRKFYWEGEYNTDEDAWNGDGFDRINWVD